MSSLIGYFSSIASAVFDFNAANLSGALDIIAVTSPDDTIACTPFHVRFGKWKVLRSKDKLVYVYINGAKTELVMQLGSAGDAYFLCKTGGDADTAHTLKEGQDTLGGMSATESTVSAHEITAKKKTAAESSRGESESTRSFRKIKSASDTEAAPASERKWKRPPISATRIHPATTTAAGKTPPTTPQQSTAMPLETDHIVIEPPRVHREHALRSEYFEHHKRRRQHRKRRHKSSRTQQTTAANASQGVETSGWAPSKVVKRADMRGGGVGYESDTVTARRAIGSGSWRRRLNNADITLGNAHNSAAKVAMTDTEGDEDDMYRLEWKLGARGDADLPSATLNEEEPVSARDAAAWKKAVARARRSSNRLPSKLPALPRREGFGPKVDVLLPSLGQGTERSVAQVGGAAVKAAAELTAGVAALIPHIQATHPPIRPVTPSRQRRHRTQVSQGVFGRIVSLFRGGDSDRYDSDLDDDMTPTASPLEGMVAQSHAAAALPRTQLTSPPRPVARDTTDIASPLKSPLRSPGKIAVGIGPMGISSPPTSFLLDHGAGVSDAFALPSPQRAPQSAPLEAPLTLGEDLRDLILQIEDRPLEATSRPRAQFWVFSPSQRPQPGAVQLAGMASGVSSATELSGLPQGPEAPALRQVHLPLPFDLHVALQFRLAPTMPSSIVPFQDPNRDSRAGFIFSTRRCHPLFSTCAAPSSCCPTRRRSGSFDLDALTSKQRLQSHAAHRMMHAVAAELADQPISARDDVLLQAAPEGAAGEASLDVNKPPSPSWFSRLFSRRSRDANANAATLSTRSLDDAERTMDSQRLAADESESLPKSSASVISADETSDTGGYESDMSVEGQYMKSLRPTNEQLKLLPLKPGANDISFVAQNGEAVSATLYLWNYNSKIVISDIDGTITKSDVRGHIYNLVGWDWTHAGVAQLYSNIVANGYHIVYLTSRAIGQVDATKDYLSKVAQAGFSESDYHMEGGKGHLPSNTSTFTKASSKASDTPAKVDAHAPGSAAIVTGSAGAAGFKSPTSHTGPIFKLPPGPVITSPDRLLAAFTREVLLRKPQEFKIAALSDIARLFPHGARPFYAGFGNRITDVVSYRAVHVADSKIFIINPQGEIRQFSLTYCKSYPTINALVHEMFPPMTEAPITAAEVGARYGRPVVLDEAFGDVQYWKQTLPAVPKDVLKDVAPAKPVLQLPASGKPTQRKELEKPTVKDAAKNEKPPAKDSVAIAMPAPVKEVAAQVVVQPATPVPAAPEAVRIPLSGGIGLSLFS